MGLTLSVDLFERALEITSLHDQHHPKPDLALEIRPVDPARRPGLDQTPGKLHVSLAGPNPEHMDDEFLATSLQRNTLAAWPETIKRSNQESEKESKGDYQTTKGEQVAAQEPVSSTGTPSSTTIDQDAPSTSTSQTTQESQSQVIPPGVKEEYHDIEIVIPTNVHSVNQPQEHIKKWTKDYPLDKIIGDPSRPNYADNMANEHVPSPATIRSDDQILLFNAWVPIGMALTALADVPSSFIVTTKTTSTLPPLPPSPQQSTVHRDIW
ncbi:hypothetical protein Tco_0198898 [Tanacetum coccineum]